MKVYVDFDNTIVDSNRVVVEILNEKFKTNKDYTLLSQYDFKDLFPDSKTKDIIECFDSDEFYNRIIPYNHCLYTLKTAKENFNMLIDIVTICSNKSIRKKQAYLENLLKFDFFFDGIVNFSSNNKSSVDMSDGIFIDDNINCLRSSNAKIKILFKNFENGEWNNVGINDDEIWVVNDWYEIFQIISFINFNKNEEIFK